MNWVGKWALLEALPNRRLGSSGEKNSREKTGPQKPSRDAPPTSGLPHPLSSHRLQPGSPGRSPSVLRLLMDLWGSGPSGNGWRPPHGFPQLSHFWFLLCHTSGSYIVIPILRVFHINRDSGYMGWVLGEVGCSLDAWDVVINIGGVCVHERDPESSCGRRRRLVCPGGALRR
jgi:hypothetical protein